VNLINAAGLVACSALIVFLVVALIFPERF